MPNWCENDLTVTGPVEKLKAFRDFMHATDRNGGLTWLSEEKLIPYPEEFKKQDEVRNVWREKWQQVQAKALAAPAPEGMSSEIANEKEAYASFVAENGDEPKDGYNQGGYEWCQEHWGTKWGFCRVQEPELQKYRDDEGTLIYQFDTAWSPPVPLIRKMGELFPDLIFDLRYFEGGAAFNGMLRIEKGAVVLDKSGEYFGDRGG